MQKFKKHRYLSIKSAVLDRSSLEKYLENIASDSILQNRSSKNTYPVPRLKENLKYIWKTYNLLSEHIKLKIAIHPAGEWILDNFYIIEEATKTIEKELTIKKYQKLLGMENGTYKGFARVYVLATEIISCTDNVINEENLKYCLKAYQSKKTLSMEELWNISIFLQIALIENIRQICEKIYTSQIQKYRVENIIERLVENKNTKIYNIKKVERDINPFIEHMSYRLKSYGKKSNAYLSVLEEEANKMGMKTEDIVKKEHYNIALKKVSVGNAIKSIKEISRINLEEIFEETNGVEEILKNDPSNVYEKMDYKTKEYYRASIKKMSEKTKVSEVYIAKKALELANNNTGEKKSHIGYYLIDKGERILKEKITEKEITNTIWARSKSEAYILLIVITTAIISLLIAYFFGIIIGLLCFIPISEIVIKIVQYILSKIIPTKIIPKLNYSEGIPEESATFVVIPTILKDVKKVNNMIEKLEVYYLANKSENIYFALLGDASESKNEKEDYDKDIINAGIEAINALNSKYKQEKLPIFHFLYRKRTWNLKEESYIGWERKRGLLCEFNEYVLGHEENKFIVNTIEKSPIKNIKYIITLDADTKLTLNSGIELVATMSHVLNKPELSKNKDVVIDGYGIMQPRVGIDIESARKNLFTKIFGGRGGIDSYVNAVSDTYQDNFSEGIFTGKGIYDVAIFSKILKNTIPENTLLSHDLIEGNYLKCGFVGDIMLMDGCPSKYNAFMREGTQMD